LANYVGARKIIGDRLSEFGWFLLGAPQMIGKQLEPLSPEARHLVLPGVAMGFYHLHEHQPAWAGKEATEGPHLS
jgi:hypothetical protein